MAEAKFKASVIYVVPIFATLLTSVICAFLISRSEVELEAIIGFSEIGFGPLINAIVFVLAAAFGATVIYFLLRRGVHLFIRLLMGFAYSVLTFFIVIFYSELVLIILNTNYSLIVTLAVAFLVTVLVVSELFVRKGRFYGVILLVLGGAIGSFIGASIPILSAILILLLLAVYDVVAVFRGPVGKIAAKGLEHLPGATFPFREIHVGLGDLVFYSMLASRMFLSFGWEVCIAAMLGILLGSYFSFKMVEKKGMFPGLPFSIILGLLAGFMTLVLL